MKSRVEEAWREWIGDEADHSQVGFARKAFFDAWELALAARDVEWCTVRQHLAERIKALEGGIVAENNRVVSEHSALRARIAELEDQLYDFQGVVED